MKKILHIVLAPLRLLGRILGTVNTFILMVLSFYLILTPMGVTRRFFRHGNPHPSWIPRPPLSKDHFKRQY